MEKIELTDEEKAEEEKKALIVKLLNALFTGGDDFEIYSGEEAKKWDDETGDGQIPLVSMDVLGSDGKKRPAIEIGIVKDEDNGLKS